MKDIVMDKVDSSVIAELGYDPEEKKMNIRFVSGSLYQYSDVPPELYAQLRTAESVGKAFLALVQYNPDYPALQLEAP